MPSKIDLTGRRFGRWRVLAENATELRPGAWWTCECGCGHVESVRSQSLREGKSRQCRACRDRESQPKATAARIKDLTGQRFGSWTVIARRDADNKYQCVCDCGRRSVIAQRNLACRAKNKCQNCRRRGAAVLHSTPKPLAEKSVARRKRSEGRRLLAAALRAEGKTLAEVGAVMGVSGERARQLLLTSPGT